MPRLLEPGGHAPAVRGAARRLIAKRGLPGLSLRAIAGEAGIAPATLVHQFTHRTRLWGYLVACAKRDLVHATWARSHSEGVLAFLPATEEDLVDVRVWLAWCELARSDDTVTGAITDFREEQRGMLDILTEQSLDETGLDVLVAVVDGLNAAVCAREEPLPLERARAALARHCPPGQSPAGADHVSGGRTSGP